MKEGRKDGEEEKEVNKKEKHARPIESENVVLLFPEKERRNEG